MSKIIICDWGYYVHKAIFSPVDMPSTYVTVNMLLGDLKAIEINDEDEIFIAVDNHQFKNWRKELFPVYKSDRKVRKDADEIDWRKEYKFMNWLRDKLEKSTPFQFIDLYSFFGTTPVALEADDIMAIAPKYYKDKEIILISADSDLEQLYIYDNCKIFSPLTKRFKVVKNPYKILNKKIIGKETSDNLRDYVTSEVDYDLRKKIVSLIELPEEIENVIINAFDNLQKKDYSYEHFPYPKLLPRLMGIYNNDKVMTYEATLKYLERKKKKDKIKKEKKKQLEMEIK